MRRAAPASPALLALAAVGLLLSVLMAVRSQVGGDQLNLLARGWRLVEEGHLVPHGNPLSGGGKAPGSLTSLVVGLPLFLWRDHRAPVVVIWLTHLLAYLLLDRVVREALSARERLLFCGLYWLNPWRLYFSAFLWNPNYLFLAGAVHLWTAWRLRSALGARAWLSFLHAVALAFALQLHPSAVLLVLASALLLWRRVFRIHAWGAAAGLAAGSLTLLPWLLEAARNPLVRPGGEGFLGRGLVTVLPVLRGLGYWLRYPSTCFSRKMALLDLGPSLGEGAAAVLDPLLVGLLFLTCALTLVPPLLGNLRLWKRWRRHAARPESPSGRSWLGRYVFWTAVGAGLGFCLIPTTVMMWQGLVVLHAAVLPAVGWIHLAARTRRCRALLRRLVPVHLAVLVVFGLAMAFGSPHYRCGGRGDLRFPLRADHPMLHELGIHENCRWPVVPGAWWPDALP